MLAATINTTREDKMKNEQMEESKNTSEAFRVCASLSAGSQFDKEGAEFPGRKKQVMKDGRKAKA